MKSIRLKLWSWLMLLVVAVLVLLWLFQVVFLEQFYYKMHFDAIESRVQSLVDTLESEPSLLDALGRDEMISQIENLSENLNLGLEILDEEGRYLLQYSITTEPMFKRSLSDVVNNALKGNRVVTTISHPRFDSEFWILSEPIKNTDGKIVGCILVMSPIEAIAETTKIIKQQLLYITIILLILASAIAFAVSKQFSKPIVKISQAAKELSKGNFNISLDVKSQDEIGQLSKDILEMGQSLGQIDRLRKELIGNISHELRTPLSIIRGYAETLRDITGDNPEKRSKQLDIIVSESERLGQLIEDVLNMSQLESGAVQLNMTCFDIVSKLNQMRNRFDIVHNINVHCAHHELNVIGDPKRIEQVLYNLIGNAVQHSDSYSPIDIKVSIQDNWLKIEVVDQGMGISEDELPHIWDRFYQAKDEKEGKPKGSGLGLAIVKAILNNHDSKFGVESKVGVGTTFWFILSIC